MLGSLIRNTVYTNKFIFSQLKLGLGLEDRTALMLLIMPFVPIYHKTIGPASIRVDLTILREITGLFLNGHHENYIFAVLL